MTAALYRLPAGALASVAAGEDVTLDGAEAHHAVTVKRTQMGEHVLLADGGPHVALAEVTGVGDARLTARVLQLDESGSGGPQFVLVQALAKGDRDLAAIEAATELGVDAVVPWSAERSIVQWKGERAVKAHRKWVNQVEAAAKQSRRATVPPVRELVTSKQLRTLVDASAATLVLHEEAEERLLDVPLPEGGEVLLVVGPEGGITPSEIEQMAAAGARAVRLGREILRASTAGPAALAVLAARTRWSQV